MKIDFRGIRMRLQWRLERLQWQALDATIELLLRRVRKLDIKTAVAELEENFQKRKQLHTRVLFTSVGQALSTWASMENVLITIAALLLRTEEATKVGIIMYSIINFNVWISIIGELFLQEPRYIELAPKWNKMASRLRGLKETRDRLAHHTIHSGDRATTIFADTSLRPGLFDVRQKIQKYQPLNFDEISKFMLSTIKVHEDLTALLNAMTALLTQETSQQKSPEPNPDQRQA
jgi:hypothetical protein